VTHERERLDDERTKPDRETPPERLVHTWSSSRGKAVVLSSAPDRLVGLATRNLFSGLLAHRNFGIGKRADAANVIPITMRDQHMPNRSAKLQPSAAYPGNLLR
jgi:hypothetical protein